MNETLISLAKRLLSKHFSFCLYRFPDEDLWHLATLPELLPNEINKAFWIRPFSSKSRATELLLKVCPQEMINGDFLEKVEQLPEKIPLNKAILPSETHKQQYFQRIEQYLKSIRAGMLDKAILSSVIRVAKPDSFDSLNCFVRLCETYKSTFNYLLYDLDNGTWLGATPELLLEKQGQQIKTVALAGTQERSQDGNYIWRQKETEEQKFVSEYIKNIFSNFGCKNDYEHGPITIESAQVAHLKTLFEFEAGKDFNLKTFLSKFHPTPAVGGLPLENALSCINKNEGYDRCYYTGFIGETDFSKTTKLFVNLRCMQVGERDIAIYVGGGITADSNPEEEWRETRLKSKTMISQISSEVLS